MFRRFSKTLELLTAGFIGAAFFSFAALAWSGPTAAPPGGNVAPPINVGTTDQVKDGGVAVNVLAVFGNTVLAGSSRYLLFNSAATSTGYGFRDNAGVMQFRNADGAWADIGGSSQTHGARLFTSSGTFTVPAGVSTVKATLIGGGGGGTASYYQGGLGGGNYNGIGGGSGAVVIDWIAVTPGAQLPVTVGVGGTGQPSYYTGSVSTGTASTFGGKTAQPGGAPPTSDIGVGGPGGIASGGTININGKPGSDAAHCSAGGEAPLGMTWGDGGNGSIVTNNNGSAGSPGKNGIVLIEW
jgi:hypothetical protein